MQTMQGRRRFVAGLSSAGAACLVRTPPLRAEPILETTTVRLPKIFGSICQAPEYVAGELLRAEGFTDVFVDVGVGDDPAVLIANGELDFDYNFAPAHITSIDAGVPITVLAGLHSGCLELIANDNITAITDLKGKRVGVDFLSSQPHVLVTLMAAYVGLDPERDIEWVTDTDTIAMQLFIDGKVDAFLAGPPEPQELRARKIGHTVLATTIDRPWSQYFCCLLAGTSDYVSKYPVATKHVLRAILKAADLCIQDPRWVAQQLVDRGFTPRYDYAIETLTDARYDRWREFDPEDTLRFFALRMHEAGIITSSPQTIITDGTDWRFLDELKRELKT